MEMIKLVIKIPEKLYNISKFVYAKHDAAIAILLHAVRDSVPLPKKYGRLIDADSLLETLRTYKIDAPSSDAEFERNRIVDFIIDDIAAETTILDAENDGE